MNNKLSGAKLVLVSNLQMGVNKLPFVEDLRNRVIKYIDFFPVQYLPDTTEQGVQSSSDMYLTLADTIGNSYIQKEMPLERFDYTRTIGIRQPVMQKISLQNSYILCQNVSNVGLTAALIFWYDLPEFSARNKSDNVVVDFLSVPLTTATRYNALPDEERMSGKRFRYLWVGNVNNTPEYASGLDSQYFENVYLTARKGSYNVLENVPVALLYQLEMLEKTTFANIIFDLQNSFVTIGGAGTIPNVNTDYIGKSVFFNFAYEK